MRKIFLTIACCLAFSGSALAETDAQNALSDTTMAQIAQLLSPESLLRGQITEDDVTEIFAILRSGMLGKPAEPSEQLRKKLEMLGQRMKVRGAIAGMLFMDELERATKEMVREINRDPNAI
ncbi:MAG: hypothetical protein ACR2FI_04965 [Burkholderiales bacterium]|nr:hypothetical protein [Burkholderiales bacterium]MDQ3196176.1 hypothetical protein [Pseudomonadota bacterium]